MKGIIVLEGADGTGKTTLAKALVTANGGKGVILHQTYRWKHKMPTYHLAAVHRAIKLQAQDQLVIIDRLWLSEYLYAKEFRGGTRWPGYGRQLQRVLTRFGAMYVFCSVNNRREYYLDCVRLVKDREELYPDPEAMARLNQNFEAEYWTSGVGPATLYDHHLDGDDQGLNFATSVLDSLDCHQEQVLATGLQLSIVDTQVVGEVIKPCYIFIGEQPNPKVRALQWPWVDLSNSATSYLDRVLIEAGIPEEECCFSNVLTAAGEWNEELVYLIQQGYADRHPQYVLLGQRAQRAAPNYYLIPEDQSYYLKHPQWYRRFDYHGDKLVSELRSIAHATST